MGFTDYGTPLMATLFEVLEVPYAQDGAVYGLTAEGDAIYTGMSVDSIALQKAYSGICTWISGMSGSGLDRLSGLLTGYESIGNGDDRMDGGSVGDIAGLSFSSRGEREEIARRVRIQVPFYRSHDLIRRTKSGATIFST